MTESQKNTTEMQMIHIKNSLKCKVITNLQQEDPKLNKTILKNKVISHGIENKKFQTDKKSSVIKRIERDRMDIKIIVELSQKVYKFKKYKILKALDINYRI